MIERTHKYAQELINLMDLLSEPILTMSDDELIADMHESRTELYTSTAVFKGKLLNLVENYRNESKTRLVGKK